MNTPLSFFASFLSRRPSARPIAGGLIAFLLSAVLFATPASAVTEGKEYRKIQPQTVDAPAGKIEVIEFFSYLCGHCAEYNPQVEAWKKKLPNDVVFTKIPLSWGKPQWRAMVRVYYALDALGEETRLSADVFNAVQRDRINLTDSKIFLDWAASKGIDRKKLEDVYNSFTVNSKVTQAEKKSEAYKVQSVPHFYVDGQYEVVTETVSSVPQALAIVEEVIDVARKAGRK